MKTEDVKRLDIRIPDRELKILKTYCEKTKRTQTEVLREFIRTLPHRKD